MDGAEVGGLREKRIRRRARGGGTVGKKDKEKGTRGRDRGERDA